MAYTLTKAELSALDFVGGTVIRTYNLYSVLGRFAFGELLRLRMEITSSANIVDGAIYLFNPCLFGAVPFAAGLPIREGWAVKYVNGNLFDIDLILNNPSLEILAQNSQIIANKTTAKKIEIDFYFYAAQDQFDYVKSTGLVNSQLLQTSGIGSALMQVGQPNVYSAQSYLEFLLVEVDANLNPTTSGGDPYVRNTAVPSRKQSSFAVQGRFVDNDLLNTQSYSGTALTKNSLRGVAISSLGITKITDITRLLFPVLSDFNDNNLPAQMVDNEMQDFIMINSQNTVVLTFDCPSVVPNFVRLKLFRVDDLALINAQNFVTEYEIKATAALTNSAVAYPNPINSTPFSTPSSISIIGTVVTVTVQLNSNLLIQNGRYRIWAGLYQTASDFISSHLTPPLRVALQPPPSAVMTGVNLSYNNVFTGNDTVMTTLARHESGISIDAATYTGISFANELKTVKMNAYYDGAFLENASYNFATQSSGGTPAIDLVISGTQYFFSYQSRLPLNNSLGNKTLEIQWDTTYEYTDALGSLQRATVRFVQFIRVRPLDTSRIVGLTFLDYTDFLASIITPVFSLCEDNPFVVVQVQKNAAPDANLIALAIIGGAQNSTNPPAIYEEQGYVSPIPLPLGLPQESTLILSQVETTFVDNFAYFIVDTRLLPPNNLFNAIAAIIYNI
jgi:hypothetical protein